MRAVKLFVISIILLFLLLIAFSSLLPSVIRISRAVDINVASEKLHAQLTNLKQWEQWNEFIKVLTDRKAEGKRISSKQLMVTIRQSNTTSVSTLWVQQNGKSFPAVYNMISQDSVTTLQWYFEFRLKWYPWEKFSSLVYDKQLGSQMEQSLLNLKLLLEEAQ